MSFDIFLNAYERCKPATFPLAIAESALGDAIAHRESSSGSFFWRLEYPVNSRDDCPKTIMHEGIEYPVTLRDGSEIYGSSDADNPTLTSGFMVARPASHPLFYASLLLILQATSTALFWPGERSLVIGREETLQHLPSDMIATLGLPFLVTEPHQIVERIYQS